MQAKSDLEAAQTSVTQLQVGLTKLDVASLSSSASDFQSHARSARDRTNDPLFRMAEAVPGVGPNLTAVRELSDSLDNLGTNVLTPVMDFSKTIGPDTLRPVNGALNVGLLTSGDATLASADDGITSAVSEVSAIDTSSTISQIGSAQTSLVSALNKAHEQIVTVRSTVKTVSNILGMNGTRHYLLAFLNNAETTGLGGGPASISMLTVDNGAFAITDQASSQDFPITDGPVRDIDQNVKDIFGTGVVSTLNWSTSRPDFPTAGRTISDFWQKYRGGTVDGVISVDPIALSNLLAAAGPVTLPSTGEQITADNAVSLLLHDVYLRYAGPDIEPQSDAFFKEAAKSIFTELTTTKADPAALLAAVNKSIDSGNILAWSAVADEEKLLDGSKAQGVLPVDNAKSTLVGTYFRDVSTSKTDYWLQTAVALNTDVCTNKSNPTFTETVTLHSTITAEEARTLPIFITGVNFEGRKFSTEVYVYGPVGATTADVSVGSSSVLATVRPSANDLGRPVARFLVDLAPGETNTATVTFSGAPGAYGTPVASGTPMMNPTATTLSAPGCN